MVTKRKEIDMSRIPSVLTLLLVFFGVAATTAQKKEVTPPGRLDALSNETLSRWEKLEYLPSKLGILCGEVEIHAALSGQRGAREGKAVYKWDLTGKKPRTAIQWDNESLGRMLSREGWSRDDLDRYFVPSYYRKMLRGTTMKAHRQHEKIIIDVTRRSGSEVKQFVFDKRGVLAELTFEVSEGGYEMAFRLQFQYRMHGRRYVLDRTTLAMDAGFGKVTAVTKVSWKKVGDHFLMHRFEESSTCNGEPSDKKSIEFKNWRLGGDR